MAFTRAFSVLIAVLLSSLVHALDPDVDGVAGLFDLSVGVSVLVYAIFPLLLMLGVTALWESHGRAAAWVGCLGGGVLLAVVLVSASTPYSDLVGLAVRVLPAAAFLAAVLAVGSVVPLTATRSPSGGGD